MDQQSGTSNFKWTKPEEVMKLHQLKKRKNALQARIKANKLENKITTNTFIPEKRKNPFAIETESKRIKNENLDDSDTLFKLLHCTSSSLNVNKINDKENKSDFNVLNESDQSVNKKDVEIVRGESFFPIDWTLKTKVRFIASKPFQWSQKLKTSEEASSMTGFARCLDTKTTSTSLDSSSNAKFHQCCLYWIQPSLPWLNLFPRTFQKSNSTPIIATNLTIKESLHRSFTDGLKSLFQLLRTRQCPYFYLCTNNFTALFRAAGIGGFTEMNVTVSPTTRGFRQILRSKDIEFKTPLKKKNSENEENSEMKTIDDNLEEIEKDEEEDVSEEEWLKQMGIGIEDIKKINFTQEKITNKIESEIDNGAESLIFIEGIEVSSFYNYLMNCKSIIPTIGALAGVPPTLLSPIAFNGGTINSLKIRENKINVDNERFFSVELQGPILPHLIHNLYYLCRPEMSVTALFTDLKSTQPFSKVKFKKHENEMVKDENVMTRSGSAVFKKENLTDCGFPKEILESFCSEDPLNVTNYDSLKFCNESKLYNWN